MDEEKTVVKFQGHKLDVGTCDFCKRRRPLVPIPRCTCEDAACPEPEDFGLSGGACVECWNVMAADYKKATGQELEPGWKK